MKKFRLAIVGGGPSCTYVLERLAATALHISEPFSLEIHIFEKTGEFGSGAVHSAKQPTSSFLNRIVGQVAFAADETIVGAGPLLPRELRPTLYEWCRAKLIETGDPVYALDPEDWPRRYLHGLALQDAFHTYLDLLSEHPSIQVSLHNMEVIGASECGDGFRVETNGSVVRADNILFLTGHSNNDPLKSESQRHWVEFARSGDTVYIPHAYPLERVIPEESVTPARVVGCIGMGLTAIDVILYLTEGRGGRFVKGRAGDLIYISSGKEPKSIIPFGRSGLFTFARPFNAKEQDPSRFEHKGVFLTEHAINRLRRSVGRLRRIAPFGERLQLDFEKDVLPIVLLEMAYVYYKTLLGEDFADHLKNIIKTAFESFLNGELADASPEEAIASFLDPVNAAVTEAFTAIERFLSLSGESGEITNSYKWSFQAALDRYLYTVYGPEGVASRSPQYGHSDIPEENRFSWESLINPISRADCSSPERYRKALLSFMERDIQWAAQNNLDNPQKAAADGVWRDLRQVLAHVVDFGGLTASSHQNFLTVYMRYHNRLANGAASEIMCKIKALIEHGILDVSIGPGPIVGTDPESKKFTVSRSLNGARLQIDTLIDAKVHPFDPENDVSPLFRNMLNSGLILKWRNPGNDGSYFEPGGLSLDSNFHPVRADGSIDTRLTFLGPPSEGVMFFQLGALRPNQNHHVMRDIVCWMQNFWLDVLKSNRD
jgi:hypothetical protein